MSTESTPYYVIEFASVSSGWLYTHEFGSTPNSNAGGLGRKWKVQGILSAI